MRRLELRAKVTGQGARHLQRTEPNRLTDGDGAIMAAQTHHAFFADCCGR